MLYEETSTVYVRLDGDRITDINSSAFLGDTRGWTAIDAGTGDRFRHAYRHYLPGRPLDGDGISLWKLAGGKPVERTAEEIEADRAALVPPAPTALEQLRADVDFLAIMQGVEL